MKVVICTRDSTKVLKASLSLDPGMCVKTKNIAGDKVFLNFCKVHAIPPAKPISENALQDIIAHENYNSDYRQVNTY